LSRKLELRSTRADAMAEILSEEGLAVRAAKTVFEEDGIE